MRIIGLVHWYGGVTDLLCLAPPCGQQRHDFSGPPAGDIAWRLVLRCTNMSTMQKEWLLFFCSGIQTAKRYFNKRKGFARVTGKRITQAQSVVGKRRSVSAPYEHAAILPRLQLSTSGVAHVKDKIKMAKTTSSVTKRSSSAGVCNGRKPAERQCGAGEVATC